MELSGSLTTQSTRKPERKRIRLPLGEYRISGASFFVTICCNQKKPRLLPLARRELVRRVLVQLALQQRVELASYTVIPTHVHFIASGGTRGLIGFVRDFKSATTRLLRQGGLSGLVRQRSFFDHKLRSAESLGRKCRYIWMNPVRLGLVEKPEEYRWSGAFLDGRHYTYGRANRSPSSTKENRDGKS